MPCLLTPRPVSSHITLKTGGKLLFPLCRTSAEQRDLGPDDRCPHTDAERSLTGTWVTSELQKALELEYRLDQIYELWHFPESSHDLFASYINTFLKIKHEASGYSDQCNTPKHQQEYIQDILRREGILLNADNIKKSPVQRTIAKLFLNCFWPKD
jgi:hypothetical protein